MLWSLVLSILLPLIVFLYVLSLFHRLVIAVERIAKRLDIRER